MIVPTEKKRSLVSSLHLKNHSVTEGVPVLAGEEYCGEHNNNNIDRSWHGQKVGMDESAARGVLGVKRIAWDGM